MATAKKGIINGAMSSKPVVAAKGLINTAIEAFNEPPLAPDRGVTTKKPRRPNARNAPTTKAGAKKAPATKAAKKMDRKLVAAMEDYEVKYLAQKHGVTQKAVKAAVKAVGSSRNKVEAVLKRQN